MKPPGPDGATVTGPSRDDDRVTELMNEPRVRLMVESADDRGILAEEELAAVAVDLDLDEEDLEALTAELSEQGVEIVSAADADGGGAAARAAASALAAEVASAGPIDSLDRYLHEISRHPLLTKEDEQRLAKRVEEGDRVAKRR